MNPRRLLPIAVLACALAAVPASAQAAPPPNDAFATAQPLTLDVPVQGTVADATVEANEPAHAGDRRSKSVWYSYTSPTDGAVTLDACDANFDDVIATYTGTALNALTAGPSVDDACNDLGAKVSLQVKAGVTVWIAIAGVEGGSGTFTVVAHAETVPPERRVRRRDRAQAPAACRAPTRSRRASSVSRPWPRAAAGRSGTATARTPASG